MPNLNRAAPLKPMQIITTDFMGPVPRATPSGNKYALVIIDQVGGNVSNQNKRSQASSKIIS